MSKTNWNSHWFQSWTSFDCFLEGKLIDYRNREENRVGRKIGRRSSHPQIIIPGCHSHQFRILARDSPNLLFFLLPITDQHVFPEFIAGVFNFFLERSWKKMPTALEQGGENHSTRMLEWQWIQIQLSSWSRFDCSKKFKKFKKKIKKKKKIKIQKNFGKWIVPGDLFSLFLLQFPKGLARTIGFWFWASAASSSLGLFLCSFPLALSAFHSNLSWAMSHSPPGFSMWNLKGSLHHRILALFFFDQKMKVCWRN